MKSRKLAFSSSPSIWLSALTAVLISVTSLAANADDVSDRINTALANPARDAADSDRDAARKPAQAIEFIGIKTGMRVLDVSAGGGWYSEVLAAAVGPGGSVIAQNSSRFAERAAPALALKIARFANIESLTAENTGFGIDGQADAAWTALNAHDNINRGRESGLGFLNAIYTSLKPGGVLAVIDHEGNPGANNADLHRIDVGTTIQFLQEAGFVVEAQSYLLDNPADDHSLHMRDESLERNTDRFLLRARKPL